MTRQYWKGYLGEKRNLVATILSAISVLIGIALAIQYPPIVLISPVTLQTVMIAPALLLLHPLWGWAYVLIIAVRTGQQVTKLPEGLSSNGNDTPPAPPPVNLDGKQ